MADSWRKRDLARKYAVDLKLIERAVRNEVLPCNDRGWVKESDFLLWLSKRRNGPKVKRALALHGITDPEEAAVAADAPDAPPPPGPGQLELDGGGLINPGTLKKITQVHITPEVSSKVAQLKDYAAAMTSIAASEEKQIKAWQETGRLADVRQAEQIVNQLFIDFTTALKTLEAQYGSEVARKTKVPVKDVRAVIGELRLLLLEQVQDLAGRLRSRADQFMQDKSATTRRRRVQ